MHGRKLNCSQGCDDVSVAVESSGLLSMMLIIVGYVMESLDVRGRINLAKAFAEPSFNSADIVNTLKLTSGYWAESYVEKK